MRKGPSQTRTPTFIRRAIERFSEPNKPTVSAEGIAGYSGFSGVVGGISDVNGTLDLKPLISQGFWTDEDGWSLQWMRLISFGFLD